MGYSRKSDRNETISTWQHGTVEERAEGVRIALATASIIHYSPDVEERLLPSRQPTAEQIATLKPDTNWENRVRLPMVWIGSKGVRHPETC